MILLQINKTKFGKRLLRNTFAYYKAKRDQHRCKYDLKLATKPNCKKKWFTCRYYKLYIMYIREVKAFNKKEVKLRLIKTVPYCDKFGTFLTWDKVGVAKFDSY